MESVAERRHVAKSESSGGAGQGAKISASADILALTQLVALALPHDIVDLQHEFSDFKRKEAQAWAQS